MARELQTPNQLMDAEDGDRLRFAGHDHVIVEKDHGACEVVARREGTSDCYVFNHALRSFGVFEEDGGHVSDESSLEAVRRPR